MSLKIPERIQKINRKELDDEFRNNFISQLIGLHCSNCIINSRIKKSKLAFKMIELIWRKTQRKQYLHFMFIIPNQKYLMSDIGFIHKFYPIDFRKDK